LGPAPARGQERDDQRDAQQRDEDADLLLAIGQRGHRGLRPLVSWYTSVTMMIVNATQDNWNQ
jgi:hypothetical protein